MKFNDFREVFRAKKIMKMIVIFLLDNFDNLIKTL